MAIFSGRGGIFSGLGIFSGGGGSTPAPPTTNVGLWAANQDDFVIWSEDAPDDYALWS